MTKRCSWTPLAVGLALVATACPSGAAGGSWQPVECVPADLPAEELFEVVQPLDGFEDATPKWTVAVGSQHARAIVQHDPAERHGGGGSLRVDYDFLGQKDYEYIQLNGRAEFAQQGLGFGFWLNMDTAPLAVRLRVADAGGECHQIDMSHAVQAGWQFVAALLDAPSTAWGGDGNQRKDYPLKLIGIVLDRPQVGFVKSGRLWIDDAAVVKARPPAAEAMEVETQNGRFGNLYAVGETVSLRARGAGDRVRWSVVDFFGDSVAQGEAAGAEARFTLSRPGWFCCRLELLGAGRVVASRRYPCAALPGGAEPARSDFVGVCSHFGQNAYPLETMDLMRRYGIDQYRDEISWRGYEREQGRYVMPDFAAAFLRRSVELQLRPLLIFDYSSPHYDDGGFPNSPAAIAAFGRYAVDLARQTRDSVNMFEVWNEWIGGCGMSGRPGVHDGEAYGRLLGPTYAAVKQARPEATIVGIGGEYGPRCADHILDAVRTAGPDAMDAWSIHPYRYPRSPEASGLVDEVNGIAAKVAAAGVRSQPWITEIGYPTHRSNRGCDEATQARYGVRTLALLQATRTVEKVFWYDLKDDGLSRDYNEHNFGLVRHQRFGCAPKPGIVAMSVFIRLTAKATFQDLQRDGGLYAARYRRWDGSDLLLIWTEQGTQPVSLAGDVDAAWDLMGAPRTGPGWTAATENPVYVAGRGLRLRKP